MATKTLKSKLKCGSIVADCEVSQDDSEMPGILIQFPASDESNTTVELTEDGIAEDFATHFADHLRFDHDRKAWFVWSDTHWKQNGTNLAFDHVRRHTRTRRGENKKLATKNAVSGVEIFARSDRRLATTAAMWDKDPMLLATPGGTVDLKTGELQTPNREHYITRITEVGPAPEGTSCPLFGNFLKEITKGDVELARFLQQLAGYEKKKTHGSMVYIGLAPKPQKIS